METTEINLSLSISGRKMENHITSAGNNYDEWELNAWGVSDDFHGSFSGPAGYTATGEWGFDAYHHDGATIYCSASGNTYNYTIHLGKKAFTGNAYARGYIWGKFQNLVSVGKSTTINQKITVDKTQSGYALIMNCADLVPADWSDKVVNAVYLNGDQNILYKLTNSPTDANATTKGTYLWAKYSDTAAPLIKNVTPINQEKLLSPSIEIRGEFTDGMGSGIDLNGFELYIDRGMQEEIFVNKSTTSKKGLEKLTTGGFVYKTIAPLKSANHNLYIRITDKHGNITEYFSEFQVDVKSYNTHIGGLPVASLAGVGAVNATKFALAGINTIGDLVNREASSITVPTGLTLKYCTTEIQRARVACTQIKFIKGQFQELFSMTMNTIMGMSNQQLRDLDIEVEDWQEIENIRESIGLLYICLDGPVADQITFGQLTWDEV
ncbi:MAG: hypothetical protein JNK73_13405 [Bacteroidia bacterium]|nr:hypothetical protein [Bacteroidia bacterium]